MPGKHPGQQSGGVRKKSMGLTEPIAGTIGPLLSPTARGIGAVYPDGLNRGISSAPKGNGNAPDRQDLLCQ